MVYVQEEGVELVLSRICSYDSLAKLFVSLRIGCVVTDNQ